MIPRRLTQDIEEALQRQAVVAILGPRQVGKTTLALQIGDRRNAVYLDLEDAEHRARLDDPALFFEHTKDRLVILDEIHRVPELFRTLRGVVDRGRREGLGVGRFLVLGSASIDLLRQSGETLAGRISYLELSPLQLREIGRSMPDRDRLWLRGGFPQSFTAASDRKSLAWRKDLIRTYLEREVAIFAGRLPAVTLGRLWTMLAHQQGALLNASELARALNVSFQSVTRYIDLLVDLLLIRKLEPYHANIRKRLVKSPKLYLRDSGLLHALLGIDSIVGLSGHPIIGASWEGFVLENIIAALPWPARAYFYRTGAGAEIDLVLEFSGSQRWALEIKRKTPKAERGFHAAIHDIEATRRIVVHGGDDEFPLREGIEAMGVSQVVNVIENHILAA
jgi:predicted AAA+ superfamily ATPase